MRLSIQLKPLLVYTHRETADAKPPHTDTFVDIVNHVVPGDIKQASIDKMVEINIHLHDFVAKLITMGLEKLMRWNYGVMEDGNFYIDALLPRNLTEQEYHYITQMTEYLVAITTKMPIAKKIGDRNILLSIKTDVSAILTE